MKHVQIKQWKICVGLLCIATKTLAGVADLALSIEHEPLDDLALGQVIPFSITITNNGPEEAGTNSTIALPLSVDLVLEQNTPLLITNNPNIEHPCFFISGFGKPIPPNPLLFIYTFFSPPIAPNESITCHGLMQSFLTSGTLSIEWFNLPAFLDTDPDQSNNSITLTLGVRPPMVPALSFWALGLLILLLMYWTRSKFKNSTPPLCQ